MKFRIIMDVEAENPETALALLAGESREKFEVKSVQEVMEQPRMWRWKIWD